MNVKDMFQCADGAIDKFVRKLGPPYYPNWAQLVPSKTQGGWGAPIASWRRQAREIIADFEKCAGVHIGYDQRDVDALHSLTLSNFSEYMVEKAQHSAALVAVQVAIANLTTVRSSQLATGLRSKTPGFSKFKARKFRVQ